MRSIVLPIAYSIVAWVSVGASLYGGLLALPLKTEAAIRLSMAGASGVFFIVLAIVTWARKN